MREGKVVSCQALAYTNQFLSETHSYRSFPKKWTIAVLYENIYSIVDTRVM